MNTPWEQAAEFSDLIWASMAEQMLTEAGFPALVQTTGPGSVYPGASTIWRIMVPEGRAREAREFLKQHLGPRRAGSEGAAGDDAGGGDRGEGNPGTESTGEENPGTKSPGGGIPGRENPGTENPGEADSGGEEDPG